jgi:putative acetyltransferase
MISIRDETPDDHDRIRRITAAAFSGSEFGHNGEADLIDCLRAKCERYYSIVACSEDEVVGHVAFTPVLIRTTKTETLGMGLAPLSVTPDHQSTGVGTSLVTYGLRRLFDDSYPFVVVLGHPRYYARFGFRPASQFHISHGFPGIPQDVFFILPDANGTLTAWTGGKAYYHREFGPQHDGK